MGPAIAPDRPCQNRPMRWRMFFLLLGVPTALLVALVLVIRGGHSTVRNSVEGGPVGGAATGVTTAGKGVRLVRVGTFDSPVYVTSPPGDSHRLFVVEQTGRIRVLVNGKRRSR